MKGKWENPRCSPARTVVEPYGKFRRAISHDSAVGWGTHSRRNLCETATGMTSKEPCGRLSELLKKAPHLSASSQAWHRIARTRRRPTDFSMSLHQEISRPKSSGSY